MRNEVGFLIRLESIAKEGWLGPEFAQSWPRAIGDICDQGQQFVSGFRPTEHERRRGGFPAQYAEILVKKQFTFKRKASYRVRNEAVVLRRNLQIWNETKELGRWQDWLQLRQSDSVAR